MTTAKQAPIGLFGGTFDPIHLGHTHIAEELVSALALESMQFIPNNHPVYRKEPETSAQDRLTMVKLATAKHPKFTVNECEIHRPGPTYTIDTLREIRRDNPKQPICLILGRDVFAKMSTWHEWESLIELVHLISINRPNVQLPMDDWMQNLLKLHEVFDHQQLQIKSSGYILQFEMTPMDISATEIRNKLQRKEDVTQLIHSDVLDYIQQHHLYR